MAAGDPELYKLKNVKGTGLLGDGFDVMKILYQRDPDIIPDEELDDISTALPLTKTSFCRHRGCSAANRSALSGWTPGGRTSSRPGRLAFNLTPAKAATRPAFFLNRSGRNPLFVTEPEMSLIKGFFEHTIITPLPKSNGF
ncbi:MAG: hypothetical protein R3C26_02570 [Calditrichia bacterium]